MIKAPSATHFLMFACYVILTAFLWKMTYGVVAKRWPATAAAMASIL